MSSLPQNDVPTAIDDVFSWMCSLAVAKCAKKSEKKKASCGGAAMRKRLLIKNFVAQMLDRERQMTPTGREQLSREINIPTTSAKSPSTSDLDDDSQMHEEEEDGEEVELDLEEEGDESDGEDQTDSGDESDNEEEGEEEEEEEEEEEDDEEEDAEDEDANNNLYASPLPDISTLDHRFNSNSHGYSPHHHLGSLLETDEMEKMDEPSIHSHLTATVDVYEGMFARHQQPPICFPPTSGTTIPPVSTLAHGQNGMDAPPPSWRDTEPDLYLLERSQTRYYDEYSSTTVARDYSLGYRMLGEEYPVGATDAMMSGYEQYGGMISTSYAAVPSSFAAQQPPAQVAVAAHCPMITAISTPALSSNVVDQLVNVLPEHFMDDNLVDPLISDSPRTAAALDDQLDEEEVDVTSEDETNIPNRPRDAQTIAELPENLEAEGEVETSAQNEGANDLAAVAARTDSQVLGEEQNATLPSALLLNAYDETEEKANDQAFGREESAFVDLINVSPSMLNAPSLKLMTSTCRIEAAAAFRDFEAYNNRRITELDASISIGEDGVKYHQLLNGDTPTVAAVAADLLYQRLYEVAEQKTYTTINGQMPASGDYYRSPRKRLTNDFESITSLFTNASMSPKRIKL